MDDSTRILISSPSKRLKSWNGRLENMFLCQLNDQTLVCQLDYDLFNIRDASFLSHSKIDLAPC